MKNPAALRWAAGRFDSPSRPAGRATPPKRARCIITSSALIAIALAPLLPATASPTAPARSQTQISYQFGNQEPQTITPKTTSGSTANLTTPQHPNPSPTQPAASPHSPANDPATDAISFDALPEDLPPAPDQPQPQSPAAEDTATTPLDSLLSPQADPSASSSQPQPATTPPTPPATSPAHPPSNPPPTRPDIPAPPLTNLLILLALLLALAIVLWWMTQRGTLGLAGRRLQGRGLQISEIRSLGNRQFLIVAEYGHVRVLLGVSPGRIDYLRDLPSDDPSPGAPPFPAPAETP